MAVPKAAASPDGILVDLHAELPESEKSEPQAGQCANQAQAFTGTIKVSTAGRTRRPRVAVSTHSLSDIDGITISVPNPVTWSVMKLISARDRRRKSLDPERSEEDRTLASTTGDEACRGRGTGRCHDDPPRAGSCPRSCRENSRKACFTEAVEVCDRLFPREDAWGSRIAAPAWGDVDFKLIRDTLSGWFR